MESAFNEMVANRAEAAELGNLYLTKNRDNPPFDAPHFNATNILNQIQVHAGWRQLNVSHFHIDGDELRAEYLAESGATLWFSQDVGGAVTVFVAPYKSKAMSVNEKNIILARHGWAGSISKKDVRRYFVTYLRYCAVTSAHGNLSLSGYIYRLGLKYGDFRHASEMRGYIFRYLEPILAIIGILATLYAGNKFFS